MIDHKRVEQEFDSFCKKVIRNKYLDYKRKEKRQKECEISIDIIPEVEFTSVEDMHLQIIVFDEEEFVIKNDELHDALAALSEEELRIIMLYYFFNMTDNEIGELLGIKRTTARYRRYKIITELKSKIKSKDGCSEK